jgi:Flp pilus assembly pilin Flp
MARLHVNLHVCLDNVFRRFTAREEGQDMVEYALLAGVLSIASVAVAVLIGPYLRDMYSDVLNAWKTT